MSITVRQAAYDDAELLARLNQPIQQLHADHEPHIFKPAAMHHDLIERFQYLLATPENWLYVVEVEDVPAGYMGCVLRVVPENPFVYARRMLVIDQISVNPEFQRRGCGRALMDVALLLAKAQNVSRVTLDVWSFNEDALAFYQSIGFETYRYQMQMLTGL